MYILSQAITHSTHIRSSFTLINASLSTIVQMRFLLWRSCPRSWTTRRCKYALNGPLVSQIRNSVYKEELSKVMKSRMFITNVPCQTDYHSIKERLLVCFISRDVYFASERGVWVYISVNGLVTWDCWFFVNFLCENANANVWFF